MRLIKRLIELAVVVLIISLFMMNKDVSVRITYFGLTEPVTLAFWELVTICVSLGIIIAAIGDFVTHYKWLSERKKLLKTDQEHQQVVENLNKDIRQLHAENAKLRQDLEEKSAEIDSLKAAEEQPLPRTEKPAFAEAADLTGLSGETTGKTDK
jgi:type III secretory pathway component EscU